MYKGLELRFSISNNVLDGSSWLQEKVSNSGLATKYCIHISPAAAAAANKIKKVTIYV